MGSVAGGLAGQKKASAAYGLSQDQYNQAIAQLEAVGIPSVDAQKIILEQPEIVGQLSAEQLDSTKLADITTDPSLVSAQRAALQGLQDRAATGLTTDELAQYKDLSRKAGAQNQAQQQSILQQLAQQGTMSSGAGLAAQLSASQNAANQAEMGGNQIAAEAAKARREALQQAGNLASSQRTQNWQEKSDVAKAIDQINQFNAANRQSVGEKNLSEKQRVSEAQTAAKNQQQIYNKQLLQQQYANQMQKAGALANLKTGQAATTAQTGSNQAQAYSQIGQGVDQGLLGAGKLMLSDERCKDNIENAGGDIENMLDKLSPSEYNYTFDPTKEEHIGVMAQDLEKSDVGKEFVEQNEDGVRMVDYGKMGPFMLAALAHLHKKIKDKK